MTYMAPGSPTRRERMRAWIYHKLYGNRLPKGYQDCGFITEDQGE